MMVNPDVDSYAKTLHHLKMLQKPRKKNKNLLKTKNRLKPKYKISGARFNLVCPGRRSALLPSSVAPTALKNTLKT